MEPPEVIAPTSDDDRFHPYSDHPYETETFWVSFHHPGRRLGGWFYNQVLFNQGISNGGWVWDDSPAGALYHSLSVRDRSWGPRPGARLPGGRSGRPRGPRDPADAGHPPYSPFGIGYVFGTQDADEMFLAYTLPCIWDGEGRDPVTTGYWCATGGTGCCSTATGAASSMATWAGSRRSGSTRSTSTEGSCRQSASW